MEEFRFSNMPIGCSRAASDDDGLACSQAAATSSGGASSAWSRPRTYLQGWLGIAERNGDKKMGHQNMRPTVRNIDFISDVGVQER